MDLFYIAVFILLYKKSGRAFGKGTLNISCNTLLHSNSPLLSVMEKLYIGADELLEDSFKLAWKVYESGYRPNYIVGVWRGGAPVGIAVQELLDILNVSSDHISIRTSYYSSMGKRKDNVQVYGLSYLIEKLESEDSLLIVDDVYDTGKSISQIIIDLEKACKKNTYYRWW